jgi:deoxyribodipyrimidine photolyase-related protein
MTRLVLILGDQLTPSISSLRAADRETDVVFMAEVMAESTYVGHHKKKIALVLSAMRHFVVELRAAGWRVDYVRLDDPANTGTLRGEAQRALARHGISTVIATEPGEWRLMEEMRIGRNCCPTPAFWLIATALPAGPRDARTCAWSISIA